MPEKAHTKGDRAAAAPAGRPRVAVIDGSNVAHEEMTDDGRPRVSNLVAARRALEKAGYDPITIVDATLRHKIDDPDQLEALFDDKRLLQAPAGTEADVFVLETAQRFDGVVVSNDRYEPYEERYPWLRERTVPYMVVRGRFMLHPDGDRPAA